MLTHECGNTGTYRIQVLVSLLDPCAGDVLLSREESRVVRLYSGGREPAAVPGGAPGAEEACLRGSRDAVSRPSPGFSFSAAAWSALSKDRNTRGNAPQDRCLLQLKGRLLCSRVGTGWALLTVFLRKGKGSQRIPKGASPREARWTCGR